MFLITLFFVMFLFLSFFLSFFFLFIFSLLTFWLLIFFFSISWCNDGTQLACGGGNGTVLFANLVDRALTWQNTDVTLDENNTILVRDVLNETAEELDFRDRVIDIALGFGALVVTTNNQCLVYQATNWNTPHVEDLKEPPTLIVQCPFHFALE